MKRSRTTRALVNISSVLANHTKLCTLVSESHMQRARLRTYIFVLESASLSFRILKLLEHLGVARDGLDSFPRSTIDRILHNGVSIDHDRSRIRRSRHCSIPFCNCDVSFVPSQRGRMRTDHLESRGCSADARHLQILSS